jgi:hypothetical protein
MRCVLMALMLIAPVCMSATERKLDVSKRAQCDEGGVTLEVTQTEFRRMQRRYRPSDFDRCVKKLRQLRAGMTRKQVMDLLGPTKVVFPTISNDLYNDFIVLDDAYFAFATFDHKKRLVYLNGPFAVKYEIKSAHKKPPKT